ncbi:MAG: hypothetical protein ACRDL5_13705 [Solirubrobacteraceae bacterium]
MSATNRDVFSPREVAERCGFSYHAILRAIRRGDLQALEPVPGHYRIEIAEYERWLHTPVAKTAAIPRDARAVRLRRRRSADPARPGSIERLRAIEEA